LKEKVAALVWKGEDMAVGIRHADHVAPSIRNKLILTSPTSGRRSVGKVPSRTQITEFVFCLNLYFRDRRDISIKIFQ
jgi:hypothetical protein